MTFGTLHLFPNVIFSELHGRVAIQQPSKNNSGVGVGHHAGHWEPRTTRGNRVLVLVKAGLESVITSMVGLSREEGRADARDKGAPSLVLLRRKVILMVSGQERVRHSWEM